MEFKEFNWKVSAEDRELIELIVDRFLELCAEEGLQVGDKEDRILDLIATHNHAVRLDFEKLLRADDFNLAHDLMGIKNCLNRTTGQLENCFLPRCAF